MANGTIWVSPNGRDNGSGGEDSPLRTIQKAVEVAEPGATIAVREGVYEENIMIKGGVNRSLNSLSKDKPLEIVSADGVGAAVIKSADGGNVDPTISTIGISHLKISGFEIRGDVVETNQTKDGGPLKVIGDPDGPGKNASTNIVIEDNIFTGVGVSMVKVTKTSGVEVKNNSFEGRSSENHIDMVTVWDSQIEDNSFTGPAKIGMTMKAGSQDIVVENNLLDFGNVPGGKEQAGIQVGGVGVSRLNREPLPDSFSGFEAKNVSVRENVIVTDTETAVWLQGAADSRIEGNLLGASGGEAVESERANSRNNESNSRDNAIVDNILMNVDEVIDADRGQTNGYVVRGNTEGDLSDVDFSHGAGPRFGGGTQQPTDDTPDEPEDDAPEEPAEETPSAPSEDAAGDANTLVLRAGGNGTSDAAPEFEVLADGVSLGRREIENPRSASGFDVSDDDLFRDYTFEFGETAPDNVEVVFLNDGTTDGVNRDLVVDNITLNGTTFEAEDSGWFTPDNGNEIFAGAQEKFFVDGVMDIPVDEYVF